MRDDFSAIGGYDEVIQGYGTEDRDIYLRLAARGCKHAQFPGAFLQLLAHDREASVRHYDIKDHRLSQRINATYVQIKQDLTRQFGAAFLNTEMRTAIYGEIRRAFQQAALNGQPSSRVDITLPADLDVRFYGWQMTRVWTYLLNPLPPAESPAGVVTGGLPAARHDPV